MTARGDTGRRGADAALRLLLALVAVATLLTVVGPAWAQTYSDVPVGNWARAEINWLTNQGPTGAKVLDDYSGDVFRPNASTTRAQLAHALVIACGRQGMAVANPVRLADVPVTHRYYREIQVALKLHFLGVFRDEFRPGDVVRSWQADRGTARMVKVMHPSYDWSLLKTLDPARWEPNPGWKTGAPAYLPTEVAIRYLGLRYNHPTSGDRHEVSPNEAIDRDEVAYMLYAALHVSTWRIAGLSSFNNVTLPKLSDRQKVVVRFALRYIGYPYVYAGEFPTQNSPFGFQAHGGFDCSGFVWYVMRMHFGYPINGRSAAQMATEARPRISRSNLICGDPIYFGPKGPNSSVSSIYHAALYLGNGWFIHSTGSSDGVMLGSLNWVGWSWKTDFAWGRRVLTASERSAATP